jgi:hypothetical protein
MSDMNRIEDILKVAKLALERYKQMSSMHKQTIAEYYKLIDSLEFHKQIALSDSMRTVLANEFRITREIELEIDRISRATEMMEAVVKMSKSNIAESTLDLFNSIIPKKDDIKN